MILRGIFQSSHGNGCSVQRTKNMLLGYEIENRQRLFAHSAWIHSFHRTRTHSELIIHKPQGHGFGSNLDANSSCPFHAPNPMTISQDPYVSPFSNLSVLKNSSFISTIPFWVRAILTPENRPWIFSKNCRPELNQRCNGKGGIGEKEGDCFQGIPKPFRRHFLF